MWCEKINRIPVASFTFTFTSTQASRTIDRTVRRDGDNNRFPSHSTTSSLQSKYIYINFPIEQTLYARHRDKHRPQFARDCRQLSTNQNTFATTICIHIDERIGTRCWQIRLSSSFLFFFCCCARYYAMKRVTSAQRRQTAAPAHTLYWYLYWHSLMTW